MNPAPSLAEIESILLHQIPVILSLPPDQVAVETPLQDLGIDSMFLLELVIFIEKKFGISLMDAPLVRQDFETIRTLSKHIAKLLIVAGHGGAGDGGLTS